MMNISREENKAISTQLLINQIGINSDVLGIIKTFVFHDKNKYYQKKMEQKLRKDKLMRIVGNTMGGYSPDESNEGACHWAIWLPFPQSEDDNLQMQASTCLKCGKYVNASNTPLYNIIKNNKNIVCIDGKH